jgi:crotonobetainyl-CoA:carnitine CoA-transferase CaiB-like acyl-CoA transferase
LMKDVLARADLADDPDFRTNADRVRNGARLTAEIERELSRGTRVHWAGLMREAAVPAGIVRTVEEAMASAEMQSRGLVSEIEHPTVGHVPNIAAPFRFSETPVVDPVAAPILGQHSRSVLARTLGYDEERIDALVASGVLGEH